MNPMTNVKNIQKLNQLELKSIGGKKSWHDQYKDSAWIFIGGLPYDLSEGDILAVFSQYGEIVNINLVRDKATGKSKGFVFLCYEDQRSTILAVDNLNSMKILGRTLRVDHCENYRKPKETGEEDDLTQQLRAHGCAPKTPSPNQSEDEPDVIPSKTSHTDKSSKKKKEKKKKKKSKSTKVKTEYSAEESPDQSHDLKQPIRIKKEKIDPAYDKYDSSNSRIIPSHRIKKELESDSENGDRRNVHENDLSHESANERKRKKRDESREINKEERYRNDKSPNDSPKRPKTESYTHDRSRQYERSRGRDDFRKDVRDRDYSRKQRHSPSRRYDDDTRYRHDNHRNRQRR